MAAKVEILPVPGVERPVAQHYSRLQCDVKWNSWFDVLVLVGRVHPHTLVYEVCISFPERSYWCVDLSVCPGR